MSETWESTIVNLEPHPTQPKQMEIAVLHNNCKVVVSISTFQISDKVQVISGEVMGLKKL